MRIANVVKLGIKELRGLARDPMLLVLIVYAFTLAIYTAAKAMPETLNQATIAIVDEDQSPASSRIITAFYPPYFVPPHLISTHEMDNRMDSGLDTFALDIPPNFQRDLLAGRSPTIQLNIDATRMSQAFTGGGYIQSIVSSEVSEFIDRHRSSASLPVELNLRARFNQELDQSWFGAITNVIDSVTMLSIILTGAALIREREHGTIEHLLVMPVTPTEIMVSKIWSMGLVVLLASAFALVFVVEGALSVPIQGSVMLFLIGAALHLFATTSLGIFLATIAGSMPQFGLLLMLVLLPLQVLSGGVTPRESMPEIIQAIMLAAPNTHFIILSQGILFRGAGLDVVWPQFVALFVIGIGSVLLLASTLQAIPEITANSLWARSRWDRGIVLAFRQISSGADILQIERSFMRIDWKKLTSDLIGPPRELRGGAPEVMRNFVVSLKPDSRPTYSVSEYRPTATATSAFTPKSPSSRGRPMKRFSKRSAWRYMGGVRQQWTCGAHRRRLRLDDFGLSLEEGKAIQRRLQQELTQVQVDQAGQQDRNVPNVTASAAFMIIDLVRSIRSSAFVACACLGSAAVPAEGRPDRKPETSKPC